MQTLARAARGGQIGDDLLKKSRQGFLKRQKELARQAKKRAKAERMAARRDGEPGVEPGTEEIEGLDFHQADGIDPDSVGPLLAGEGSLSGTEEGLGETGTVDPKTEGET